MKLFFITCLGAIQLLLAACGGSGLSIVKPDVDVDMINQSSEDLSNASAKFGDNICKWGAVGRTFTAGFMSYPHPITHDVELSWDHAEIHKVEKMDLRKIYPRGKSGRLIFTVYDDRVEVVFHERA